MATNSKTTTSTSSTAVAAPLQPLTSTSGLQHAPIVPSGFEPLDRSEVSKLTKLTKSQKVNLAAVGAEILASKTYAQDFGPYAPSQADVTGLMSSAAALLAESGNAKTWARYTGDLSSVTSDAVASATETMGQGLAYALQHNPSLATTYPLLLAFVSTRSEIASTASAKKKAAKVKAAKAKAVTGSTSEAPAAATAPAATAAVVGK